MKFLVVLASFIVLSNAVNPEFKNAMLQKMQEYGAKCMQEVQTSEDDIAELLAHKIPSSHEGKCMILCMHKSFNIMTEDGSPNMEGATQLLAPLKETDPEVYEKSVKVLEMCNSSLEKDEDPCITAATWAECGMKEGRAMGMEDIFEM